jgi:hypothetical protein
VSESDWRPDDALFAPIEGPGGRRYGVISVDDPVSGRRSDEEQLEMLGVLAAMPQWRSRALASSAPWGAP